MKKTIYHLLFLLGLTSFSLLKAQQPFIGQIIFVPYSFSPSGWHDCDGSLLSIAENEALFSLIGTTYGGNGTTTFALPDARGRVIIDDGQSGGLSPYTIGQTGGTETVTLTLNQIPSHNHTINTTIDNGNQYIPTNNIPANTKSLDKEYSTSTDPLDKTTMNPNMLSPSGGSQPHDNMMPSLALKCSISLYGIYPSHN